MSANAGVTSAANAAAFADTVARSAAPPFPARRRLSAPFGLPSFTPRAFATARASFVRLEIASRSASASHDPHGQVIRLRHVDGHELHLTVPQGEEKRRVPAQSIQIGNHQGRPSDHRLVQRLRIFRPVGLAPTFDLVDPRQDLSAAGEREVLDHLALRLQSQSAPP